MKEVRVEKGEKTRVFLSGNIDSGNAAEVEQEIAQALGESLPPDLLVDAEELQYISSAGLRILLRLRKKAPAMSICNVSSDVYDILEMTGFTQMMDVGRAYRRISVEGCEVIGEGANGKVYRVDNDNVVKTYKNADALSEIQNEREVAKLALVLGIPTAISYDVVRVDDSYGSMFELLDTTSFAKILAKEPERMDWCVEEYVKLLKLIHSTDVPGGKLPHIRDNALQWIGRLRGRLSDAVCDKVEMLFREAPDYGHMIHGDYHTKNVVLSGGEVLLIDMDTLAVGHPIFELGQMYNAFIGFFESDHEAVKDFQGFDYDTSVRFWNKVLRAYIGTEEESYIKPIEDKIKLEAYVRLMDWTIRHKDESDEDVKKDITRWSGIINDLAQKVDTLDFQCANDGDADESAYEELEIEATVDNLPKVIDFIDAELEKVGCGMKEQMQIDIAVEEIFVNIAHYAYKPDTGNVRIRTSVIGQPPMATITFIDSGVPYNPLAKDDPDVTLSAEEREVGGLGIFMVKKSMDEMVYEYKDGQNVLTLKKQI